ncbi:zinc finger CCCH domain-containing protein 44 [Cornus florida]|uniref:zinc finger CCCH domain-containing protein 44 n=1 Tax=Cornus florida TaxID=4283 RepID=UPI002898F3AD|nr:zinc finger CCCH domain-containing protein 44 [Cornus florida]
MEEEDSASGLYRPHMEAHNQSLEETVQTLELRNMDGCEPIHEFDDSQLVGAPAIVETDSVVGGGGARPKAGAETKTNAEAEAEAEVKDEGVLKRKRGRPPKGQVKSPPPKKNNNEEEDVCFICFDGGSLVLCDRRGCPKAYHPSCIKRDEAFFRSKARWNCGWHICSSCQKAAHYMCYTCTYSLCKGCTKDADYLCVRGNKGFCTTCMRTVMLIENQEGNKESAQVDFDDKSSWEYLFKVYWIYLKGKLSLNLNELTQAKNPWKGVGTMGCQGQSLDLHYGASDGKGSISDSSSGHLEANSSKRRKTKDHPEFLNKDSLSIYKSSTDKGTTSVGCTDWASKELLEFVAHMKNGDTSVLSQFDVQALLLDYIKRNNLRDPHRKSQIICDLRLKNLFGKPRVGHFEMLKLLEFHFLIKEDPQKNAFIQYSIVDAIVSPAEADDNSDNLLMMGNEKRRKTRKKGEERVPQPSPDEYAAIDVHNINLIYLRRNLMESLIEDNAKFHDKVIGSIVRIRISSTDQKQDMYRLVQVVGTSKVAVPYKLGERAVDVMLDILNLDKKEAVLIDAISNQEFSEDECRRLRQSIKCGLVKRLTVGDVQEKAMALRAVKLNDWLETEIFRLNHLRDRASEKGHKKELRECVEKLQLLKTSEERQRRLHEIPEVHADPNMDPNYESEDGGEFSDKKQDKYVSPKYSGFSRNRRESISPRKVGDTSSDKGGRALKKLITCERNRNTCTTWYPNKEDPTCNERKDACGSNGLEKPGNHVDSAGSAIGKWNNQAVVRSGSFSGVASETSSATLSIEMAPSVNDYETDKLWHYRDPNGKIQGPFCMVQLRKWSTTGYFPLDMRIWGINDKESESLLLTDVLNGQFHKALPSPYEISLQSQEVGGACDSRSHISDGRWNGNMNTPGLNSKESEGSWNCYDGKSHSNAKDEFGGSNVWGSHSSNWTTPVVNSKDLQAGSSSLCRDSFKGNSSCSDQSQVHSQLPLSTISEHQYGTASHQERGGLEGETWNSGPIHENLNSPETFQPTGGQCHENQSNGQGHSGQSSGQSWKPLPVNFSSNNWDSKSSFASVAKSTDSPEQNCEADIQNLPSPTPKINNEELEGQATENKQSVMSNVHKEDSHIPDLPSPTQDDSHLSYPPSPTQEDSRLPDLPNSTQEDSHPHLPDLPSPTQDDSHLPDLPSPKQEDSHIPHLPSPTQEDSHIPGLPSPTQKDSHIPALPGPTQEDSHIPDLPSPTQEDSHVPGLPSPTPKSSHGDEKGEAAENKPSVSSNFIVQDSGPSWSSASSLVVGDGVQLPEIADEWGGYSPTPTKPSDEEMDSGLASVSSLKVPEPISDLVASPTPNSEQLIHSSPSHPASSWQVIVAEPIEFSTLAEESVSDLLAEVDAMESQCGLASPTSAMSYGGDMIQGSRNDCFSSIEGLSPTADTGKSDALSSTADIQLPSEPIMIDEPLGLSQGYVDPVKSSGGQSSTNAEVDGETKPIDVPLGVSQGYVDPVKSSGGQSSTNAEVDGETKPIDVPLGLSQGYVDPVKSSGGQSSTSAEVDGETKPIDVPLGLSQGYVDPVKSSGGQSSTNAEVDGETKPIDVPLNHSESGSNIQPPAPSTTSQKMVDINTVRGAGSEDMDLDCGGPVRRITKMNRGTGQETAIGNANMNLGASARNTGQENRPKYGGERFTAPRDRVHQAGNSGFGRGRFSWSCQSSVGGGSYPRPNLKERVCKFYERGYCKKGASCDYLHR